MTQDVFIKLVADMRKAQRMSDQNKGNQFLLQQKMKLEEQVDMALQKPIKQPSNNQKTMF